MTRLVVAVWFAIVAVAEQPPPEFTGKIYDSFQASMTGHGCEGWHYRTTDCQHNPGTAPRCYVTIHMDWRCDVHPRRMWWDLDGDLDVDLADYAIYQRRWPEGEWIGSAFFAADTMQRIRDAAQERLDAIEAAARDRKENKK